MKSTKDPNLNRKLKYIFKISMLLCLNLSIKIILIYKLSQIFSSKLYCFKKITLMHSKSLTLKIQPWSLTLNNSYTIRFIVCWLSSGTKGTRVCHLKIFFSLQEQLMNTAELPTSMSKIKYLTMELVFLWKYI